MADVSTYRLASARRRYNRRRQERAEERREYIRALFMQDPKLVLLNRGLSGAIAARFGVHRSTAWRDVQAALFFRHRCQYLRFGRPLFTVERLYKRGPVVFVTMADGTGVFSKREQHRLLREWQVTRYAGERPGPWSKSSGVA